ncbi:RNA-directed DNA polymerase, eukaryota, reverse transcriptase zinc-binding domain protein [Tanacetum coccineum]
MLNRIKHQSRLLLHHPFKPSFLNPSKPTPVLTNHSPTTKNNPFFQKLGIDLNYARNGYKDLDLGQIEKVIGLLGKNDPDSAVEVFELLKREDGAKDLRGCQFVVAHVLAKQGRFKLLRANFVQMLQDEGLDLHLRFGVHPDAYSYNILINGLCVGVLLQMVEVDGDPEAAMVIFSEMVNVGDKSMLCLDGRNDNMLLGLARDHLDFMHLLDSQGVFVSPSTYFVTGPQVLFIWFDDAQGHLKYWDDIKVDILEYVNIFFDIGSLPYGSNSSFFTHSKGVGVKFGSPEVTISHLFSADDAIITTECNANDLDNIIRVLQVLLNMLHSKLSSWKDNLLSIWGRHTLIKAVLGSLVLKLLTSHFFKSGVGGCYRTRTRYGLKLSKLYMVRKVALITMVASIMAVARNWSRPNLDARNSADLLNILFEISSADINEVEDTCVWSLGTDGTFSVKDARCIIDLKIPPSLTPSTVWDKNIPRKVCVLRRPISLGAIGGNVGIWYSPLVEREGFGNIVMKLWSGAIMGDCLCMVGDVIKFGATLSVSSVISEI